MLNKIKLLLGLTDNENDDILALLIEMVREEIKDYCRLKDTEIDSTFDLLIVKMVCQKFQRIGEDTTLASVSYGGVFSESYNHAADYTEDILRSLDAHRRKPHIQTIK